MDALWYNYDLTDGRELVKCIKQLERVCRASLEYDEWQRKCKYKDAKICPVCDDDYYENNLKCESHHHPKTLYDIVDDVLDDHLEKNDLDEMTGFKIVEEIMDKHMLDQVSYINLCQHCHKKYHDGHPNTVDKIAKIFEEREKKERQKEVKEEIDFDIVVSDNAKSEIQSEVYEPIIPGPGIIEINTEHIMVVGNTIPDAPEIAEIADNAEKEELIETAKPEIVNVETTGDFIAIDINNL